MSSSSGPSIKVESAGAEKWMEDTSTLVKTALKRAMLDMARDAAMLARKNAPSNMNAKDIKWTWAPKGAAVIAKGAPAAYDGGEVHSSFNHPVFASKNIPRNQWNWAPQPTSDFVERAAVEVSQDVDERMSASLDPIFDRA